MTDVEQEDSNSENQQLMNRINKCQQEQQDVVAAKNECQPDILSLFVLIGGT